MHGVTSYIFYQMVPISKNGNRKKHQAVNFVSIMRLSYIFLITAQLLLNDTNGDTTLSSKQLWTTSSQYADVNGHECQGTLLKSKRPNETNAELYQLRPDIIIRERNCITVIELTCSFEMNLLKSHDYKVTKYQNLRSALLNPFSHFKLILLEMSSLGFTGSSIKSFETYLNGKNLDSVRIIKKYQEVAIRASYYIYCRRNKIWPDPELISYT